MIHQLIPYSIDRNIGKAYNDAIRSTIAEDDEWFVIMDGDIAFLTPEWGRQIYEVAETTDFALLGCMTGRLRDTHQLLNGKFDTECDVFKSYEDAVELEHNFWGVVEPVKSIAGMFMMFQKKTWTKVGGFEEGTIRADMVFNASVLKIGGKIGVMKGLYAFHAYRIWERKHIEARNSNGHLMKK